MTRRSVAIMTAVALLAGAAPLRAQPPTPGPQSPGTGAGRARTDGDRPRDRVRRLREAARERRAAREGIAATETLTRTLPLGRDGSLDVVSLAGRVTVTGTGGDDVKVDAVKRVWHRNDAEARALLRELDVRVTEGPGRVDVRTVFPTQQGYDAEVELTIGLPRDTRVNVRTASGEVRVSDVRGDLRVETVSGAIATSGVGTVRLLRSVSGAVSVDGASGDEVTAVTVGGALTVRRARVRRIDARSIGGAVRVSESDAERVTLQALTGDVEYSGLVSRGGRYQLQSRAGRVTATPGGDDGFDVEVDTRSGAFRSDLPLTLREGRPGGGRGLRGTHVIGTFSGGGGLLILRTLTGDVTIARRP